MTPAVAATPLTFQVETTVPTEHGTFRFRAYHDESTGADHLAIIAADARAGDPRAGDPRDGGPRDGALVRVQSECLTGEVFGSLKCECGPQLHASLDRIAAEGGVLVYLRGHEGRGIGLVDKLRAYRLQEQGLDTVEANLALGLPADGRDYGAAATILTDLGISAARVLTNNPDKVRALERAGIAVTERMPLVVGIGQDNELYLEVKRDKLGQLLPDDTTLDFAVASRGAQTR